MPYKEKPIEKLYYSIGEVAKTLNVNVSLVRFWEKEFDILQPKKNKKGNRMFTATDFEKSKADISSSKRERIYLRRCEKQTQRKQRRYYQ